MGPVLCFLGQLLLDFEGTSVRGHPLGRVVKRQNVIVPNFSSALGCSDGLRTASRVPTRTRHFCCRFRIPSTEAIRSVTHLVLVLDRKPRSRIASCSSIVANLTAAPNSLPRVQKTFSAGPCSFSFQRVVVRPGRSDLDVQPSVDSRHGRIAFKAFSAIKV